MSRVRKAVLPVAGLGTRFLPATKAIPKEMLTIVDRPLIQYAVEECRAAGIEEFVFVTGRNKQVIEDHFDHAYELEVTLTARGNKHAELEQTRAATIRTGNAWVHVWAYHALAPHTLVDTPYTVEIFHLR